MPLIQTINNEDYSLVHDYAFKHDGCIVDVGCVGWDWCNVFIGKKRTIGIDPFETHTPEGTELFQGLLGPFNGKSSLDFQGIGSSAMSETSQDDAQQFDVLNWKTFCKNFNIDKVSVLKLNIEGSEYPLLNSLDKSDFEKIDQIAVSFHNWMNSSWDLLTESSIDLLKKAGFEIECIYPRLGWYLAVKKEGKGENLFEKPIKEDHTNTTIITGLWDLGRGRIEGWAKRDFQQYKDRFFELLETDMQMCIWIPKELEQEVLAIRRNKPTQIYFKELEDFKTWFPFFDKLQEIRTDPNWHNSAGWLPQSPQAALEYYNPMMMCKMFMVNDSAVMNPFNSEYFYWIDGGLTSTVGKGYFTNDGVLENLKFYSDHMDKLTFITYPYEANDEVHGFERKKMAEYCGVDYVNKISRGGFWGGAKKLIHKLNSLYYSILQETILNGYMGADECLFTILTYRHPELIEPFAVEGNGLVWPFFEHLKSVEKKTKPKLKNGSKTSLYVITYNSPNQFSKLLQSFELVDPDFLNKTTKILLNNSLDHTTDKDYSDLCEKYDFEQVKKDNIGICGGRQWVAEHFNKSDSDYYVFFEDDMFLHPNSDALCRMGLRRYTDNLFKKSLSVLKDNEFDYLKLSFSEFYGESSIQWAWYNVPQDIRSRFFPNNDKLPQSGLAPKPPKTEFKHVGCHEEVPFVEGELHYCNWPLWFSRKGNQKVFLDVTWQRPLEQTWMSFVFQLQKENKIKAGSLLLSPINHDRFEFYPGQERREN